MKFKIILFLLTLSRLCSAQQWDSLYGGMNRNVTCLYVDSVSNALYVGGIFTHVNHQRMWGIARWSNNQWDSLGCGIDDSSYSNMPNSTWAMMRYGNHIYVGGNFKRAGNLPTGAFARWDGTTWDSVPGGRLSTYGTIAAMMVYNNELYICGSFSSLGSLPANNIAKWDGTSWQTIGNNYQWNGTLSRMIFYNGNLYVSGFFDDPNGNTCRLARWNGQNWQFFNSVVQGGIADIWDMKIYNGELYMGGLFFAAAGSIANSIIKWNDTTWSDVGGSVESGSINPFPTVKTMQVYNGLLYCGGNFEKVGGVPAAYIASWNGTDWCGYNTTLTMGIESIAFYDDTLYAGGGFAALENDTAYCIAQWLGNNSPDTCGNTTGITENTTATISVSFYPNPANTSGTFRLNGNHDAVTVTVYDQAGRIIWKKESRENEIPFPAGDFAAGMYYYLVTENGMKQAAGKFIIE